MIKKKWALRKPLTKKAEKELEDYPELVRKLLFYRGAKTKQEAEVYLNPDYERDLLDPFLMKDMKKGVDRLLSAIELGERIVIFGDYDADGIPGSVVLSTFLDEIGFTNYEVYIPDRHNEAYGLNENKIGDFVKDNVKLIITIDCGINDVAEVKLAQTQDIDVIITDHHLVGKKLPPAYAVIDAKQEDDKYPYKLLAGCGVMFKFVCAVLKTKRFDLPIGWEKWLLDLVVIATVSDMVALTGENRMLAYYGLKVLRQTRRLGLLTLLNQIKLRPANIVEDDISFMIGPRINSASRMSHASQAYYLLTTKDSAEARTITDHLEEKNQERKDSVERIVRDLGEILDEKSLPSIIVKGSPEWGLGVLGMTSSKVVERYGHPTWLWSQNEAGTIKGSCRSDGSLNVVEVMAGVEKGFFLDFGGHPMAGGFSLAPEKKDELEERLIKSAEKVKKADVVTELLVDEELSLDQLTWATYKLIEPLAPFGMENPKPIFWLRGVEIDQSKYFGNGGLHLELIFQKSDGSKISAIGFFASPVPDDPTHIFGDVKLETGAKIDLLFSLEKSMFKNYPELRLRIVDLKKAE
ncbi:MAG TPA: single-stranded-DNA-specific exonuclease RecJ [Candidatus Paceibacterota bacterium]|nr:single-stranded-DNA-specific exonuclease RecJ [Candidatus Paceibacterota bacterium]